MSGSRYIYFLHVHRTMDEEERLRTMYTDKHGKDLDLTIGRPPGDSDVVVKSKKQWDANRHVDRRPLSQQQADGTEAVAKAYLEQLYSPAGQALAARHYFRPFHPEMAAPQDLRRFQDLDLKTIADFGGWAEAQPRFFGDGGVFDQIYKPAE